MTRRGARTADPDTARCPGGEGGALALLEAHRSAVEAVCRGRLRSRVDAADTARQVMAQAAADPSAIPQTSVGAWLRRRAERACVERIRAGARPQGPAVEVAGAGITLAAPAEALVRRTLAALEARQAQARSLRDALQPPSADVADGSRRGVGRLVPAAGAGGLLPVLAAPAVALATAAALILPGLLPSSEPPVLPTTPPPAASQAMPSVQGPSALAGPAAVGIEEILDRQGFRPLPSGTAGGTPPSASAPGRSIVIDGGAGPRVTIDDQDPEDDDVTIGFDELLGVGVSLDETVGGIEAVLEDPASGGPD